MAQFAFNLKVIVKTHLNTQKIYIIVIAYHVQDLDVANL